MPNLNYDPSKLKRELAPFYITATENEINQMLKTLGYKKTDDLFSHISQNVKFDQFEKSGIERLEYSELVKHVENIACKNKIKTSFLGDGLKVTSKTEMSAFVCTLRNLVTAYTPYQPERSQGTLQTLWIYSSSMSALTGFEAVNASFYDRATALFEALSTGCRLKRKNSVLVSEGVYPGDLDVVETQGKFTDLNVIRVPLSKETGKTDIEKLEELYEQHKDTLATFAFSQVNCLGQLEDVHTLSDFSRKNNLSSIGVINPLDLGQHGLIRPSEWGSDKAGVDMFVGEGGPLAAGPTFGGPGLGLFGIRYNQQNKNAIRQTAGRFVGKAKDADGRDCLAMILSTREQHIRRDKATSNICSNQSFIATMVGAALLELGSLGLGERLKKSKDNALNFLNQLKGARPAFNGDFVNEVTLHLDQDVDSLIQKASEGGIQLGINVSNRVKGGENLLLVSFNDIHTEADITKLVDFFKAHTSSDSHNNSTSFLRAENLWQGGEVYLKRFPVRELKDFYIKLDGQNVDCMPPRSYIF